MHQNRSSATEDDITGLTEFETRLSCLLRSDTMSSSNSTAVFDWNSSPTAAPDDDCWTTLRCQLETTRFIVQKIIVPLVVTFGVVGNTVTVAVLTRSWMKSSTNRYLTALAVYDLLYLVLYSAVSLTESLTVSLTVSLTLPMTSVPPLTVLSL